LSRELGPGLERQSGRVALVTCAEIPEGDEDFPSLIAELGVLGIEAVPAVWDARVNWTTFDLVVIRSAWDYAERRDEFLRWAATLPRVLNDVHVLEWNTDKQRYLSDLAARGVPTVPTAFLAPGEPLAEAEAHRPFVVKPAISAGGRSSAWFDPGADESARALVARIHAEGRTAMVQPYLDELQETALVYFGGEYSHSLRRVVPLPATGDRDVFYLDEQLAPGSATTTQREIADAALECAPRELLYARVDLLGEAVLELEVAEPSLYLAFGDGAAARFAAAISRCVP
jgi:glutathione synthase/RimK-type ligase-like ATP-grasp enzyme